MPVKYRDFQEEDILLFHPMMVLVGFMVFNVTFNNISVISWRSVLLVEETRVQDKEKTTNLRQVTDKLYHIILYTSPWVGFEPTTSVVPNEINHLFHYFTAWCNSTYVVTKYDLASKNEKTKTFLKHLISANKSVKSM